MNRKNPIKLVSTIVISMLLSFNGAAQYQVIQKGSDIDGDIGSWTGRSVSMPDDSTIAIGAPVGNFSNNRNGNVFIYSWNGSTWQQKGNYIDGEGAGDWSGESVSMPDANTIAIGAPYNDENGDFAGHARIYSWNGSSWQQKGNDIDGVTDYDEFGQSVSMPDANTVAIGAPNNDGNGPNSGHVRIYSWNGNSWQQKGNDIDGEVGHWESGRAISMPDANTVAIGAPFNVGNGQNTGHVRIFSWNGSTWQQKGSDIDGEAAGDYSGWSVSMPDANNLAIGAPNNDGNGIDLGHVRVYRWNGNSWQQKGNDIDGEATYDEFGQSVSMPDPNTVAIGAYNNDGNGNNSGHVRIYSWNGSYWQQNGNDIVGEAAGDRSGWSVSMPNNNTVAIGAPNNGNGNNSGHVRIYEITKYVGNGTEQLINQTGIQIFPNPTNGVISINASETKPTRIKVLDVNGREILNAPFTEIIHLPEHLIGMFVIELEVDGIICREKLLKM